ncbi:TSUP family transporter [Rhodobacterales bacterium HKCCE2091]|nr:TSUP family transporter [Rhodobacterales bacterium HKCCE2091]
MTAIAALAPFAGLPGWQVAALVLVYAASFFVKGVFGYGAVPLLIVAGSFVVEPHHAVVLAALTNLMTHMQYVGEGLRNGQRALVLRLAIFVLPSIAAGVWVFSRMDGASLGILAGAIIGLSVIADWRGWFDPLAPWTRENVWLSGPIFGTVAGLISGIIGAGAIAFITLYLRVFARDRATFRATVILMTGVILLWRSAVLAVAGEVTGTIAFEALLLLPGGLLAGWAGGRLSARMSDGAYFTGYRWVLVSGAAVLVLRSLLQGG